MVLGDAPGEKEVRNCSLQSYRELERVTFDTSNTLNEKKLRLSLSNISFNLFPSIRHRYETNHIVLSIWAEMVNEADFIRLTFYIKSCQIALLQFMCVD